MQVGHFVRFGPFFPFPQRHYLYVYNHLHSVTPEGVYFYVPALGRGGGEWVSVLFVCAGLNFCHTNLGYWTESAAPLGYSLSLNLEDLCLWR